MDIILILIMIVTVRDRIVAVMKEGMAANPVVLV